MSDDVKRLRAWAENNRRVVEANPSNNPPGFSAENAVLLDRAADALEREDAAERYQHYKGGTYVVLARGEMEATHAAVVVYRSETDGRVWVRPAAEFDGKVQLPCAECVALNATAPCAADPPVPRFARIEAQSHGDAPEAP